MDTCTSALDDCTDRSAAAQVLASWQVWIGTAPSWSPSLEEVNPCESSEHNKFSRRGLSKYIKLAFQLDTLWNTVCLINERLRELRILGSAQRMKPFISELGDVQVLP